MKKVFLSSDRDSNSPKRSLILAGGGMRLAYQAGVLKALEEGGLTFNHADGTSGGTINLAMLFSNLSPKEMCERWRALKINEFVSYYSVDKYLAPANMMAFGDADGIVNKVFPHLGIDVKSINSSTGMIGTFNVCNYTNKTNEAITNDKVSLNHLVAGISLPIFMPPVQIGNDLYTDSVWIKDANLTEAARRGAEEIWLVWAIGNIGQYKKGAFNQYVHMIEISANGALSMELDYINELNNRILKGDSPFGQKKPIQLYVIKPEYPLPLDPDLYFNKINTATLVDSGYSDAKNYLANLRPYPMNVAATKMKDQGTVICFRQEFHGDIVTKNLNGTLKLFLSVTVQNLQNFLEEKDSRLILAAHIGFPGSENMYSIWDDNSILVKEGTSRIARGNFRFQKEEECFNAKAILTFNNKIKALSGSIIKSIRLDLRSDKSSGEEVECQLYPAHKTEANVVTGLHVLNENVFWKKINAKRKFLEFVTT